MTVLKTIAEKSVDVVRDVLERERRRACVIYINPVTYLYYRRNPRAILSADGVRFDGLLMRAMMYFLITRPIPVARQSFDMTSLAPDVLNHCRRSGRSIFFAGGSEGEVRTFRRVIKKEFPGLNIAGCMHGYGSDKELVEAAVQARADVYVFGLGALKQDRVAFAVHERVEAVIFTCGAFISQTAGTGARNYYPVWADKFELRWLYRALSDRSVMRRVLRVYPIFVIRFLWDAIRLRMQ